MHKPAQVELQLDRPQLPYSEILGPVTAGGSPARYRRRQPNPIRKDPHKRKFGKRNLRRWWCELIFVSFEGFWSLFCESMMNNDEIRGVEVWVLWDYELWRKKKEMVFRSLYSRNWKWGERIPPEYWREDLDHSIRTLSLAVWSVTQPTIFNDASRVPKCQKHLWGDRNNPSTCLRFEYL